MTIDTCIDSLVSYAMNRGLAEPVDHYVLVNRLLDILRKDDYTPTDEPQSEDPGGDSGRDSGLRRGEGSV